MTVLDIENDARLIVNDTYGDAYRFTPKEVHIAIRDAMVQTNSIRPESRYVNGMLVTNDFFVPSTYTEETLTLKRNEELKMEDRWREALVFYVVYRCYLKDDADTQNANLANNYLQMYTTTVNS